MSKETVEVRYEIRGTGRDKQTGWYTAKTLEKAEKLASMVMFPRITKVTTTITKEIILDEPRWEYDGERPSNALPES